MSWTAIAPDVYRSPCERFVLTGRCRLVGRTLDGRPRYESWVELRDFGDPAEVTTLLCATWRQAAAAVRLRAGGAS